MFLAKRYLNYMCIISAIIVLTFTMVLTGDTKIDTLPSNPHALACGM